MIGLLLGLLGGGAILGGAAIGSAFRPPDPPRSNPYQLENGSGSGYSYYDYTPPSHSSSWNSSRENEEPVFRFDKETGRLDIL